MTYNNLVGIKGCQDLIQIGSTFPLSGEYKIFLKKVDLIESLSVYLKLCFMLK